MKKITGVRPSLPPGRAPINIRRLSSREISAERSSPWMERRWNSWVNEYDEENDGEKKWLKMYEGTTCIINDSENQVKIRITKSPPPPNWKRVIFIILQRFPFLFQLIRQNRSVTHFGGSWNVIFKAFLSPILQTRLQTTISVWR